MSQLRIVMTGEEAQLFQSLQKVIDQSKKTEDSFDRFAHAGNEASKAAQSAAREEAKLAREGARIADGLIKKNESLNDNYQRRKAAIEAAGAAGVKSEQEVATAIKQLKEEVLATSRAEKLAGEARELAAKAGTAEYKQHQEIISQGVKKAKELEGANKSLEDQFKASQKALKAAHQAGKLTTDEYKTSMKQLGAEHDRLKNKQDQAFGAAAIKKVGAFAASFISVTAAISVIREGIEQFNREKELALGATNSLVQARTALRQVSNGDFDKLESDADELSQLGITRVQGRELKFSARSTGFESADNSNERFVASVDSVIPVDIAAKFAGEFRQQFRGDNLNIENSFDTVVAAAADSVMNISELSAQLRTAAQGASAIGASSSDVAAVTSVFAGQFRESAGNRVRSIQENLFSVRDREGFESLRGQDLIEAIKMLRSDESLRADFTAGNKELGTAVNAAVKSLDDFELNGKRQAGILRVDQNIERAQTDAARLTMGKVAEASSMQSVSGRIERSRKLAIAAAAGEEAATERARAEGGFMTDAVLKTNRARAIERGDNWSQRLASDWSGRMASNFSSDPGTINSAADFGREFISSGELPQVIRREQAARELMESTRAKLQAMEARLEPQAAVSQSRGLPLAMGGAGSDEFIRLQKAQIAATNAVGDKIGAQVTVGVE